ncbi:hypothetical protein V8B97DRAFT_1319942 [Scleroderma yunnanense]
MHMRSIRKSSPVASRNSKVTASKSTIDVTVYEALNVNKNRDAGAWTPEKFDYPEITPYPNALVDIKPIPTLQMGRISVHLFLCSRVTMGIRSMLWNEWTELDSSPSFINVYDSFDFERAVEKSGVFFLQVDEYMATMIEGVTCLSSCTLSRCFGGHLGA